MIQGFTKTSNPKTPELPFDKLEFFILGLTVITLFLFIYFSDFLSKPGHLDNHI